MLSRYKSLSYKFIGFFLKYLESLFKIKTNYIHFAIKSYLNNKDGIIIEIGCHNGEDTIILSSISRSINIYAFEPDPRISSYLKNKFIKYSNIKFFPYAVTNLNGDQLFYATKVKGKNFKNTGSSSLLKSSNLQNISTTFKVPTIALSKIEDFEKHKILLIWVDVQGAERQVIESGRAIFDNAKLLWIEYGECDYEKFLSRKELINLFSKTHYVSKFSNRYKKGNLLLVKK